MDPTTTRWLTYAELLRRQSVHALRESDIPPDYAFSLGLPTRRWLGPGFAFFASPAIRRPGEPIVQKPADRWWVLDARTGHLIVYALNGAVPFHEGPGWEEVHLPPTSASLEEQRASHTRVASILDRLIPFFFRGAAIPQEERQTLRQALAGVIPGPLMPQYRALVPDFFAWLEA
jgi:hypothetical protein